MRLFKRNNMDHSFSRIAHAWSTISNLVRKETVILTYNSSNSRAPDYLRKLFAEGSDDRERFLRSSETALKLRLLQTTIARRLISYPGAKQWSSLERATKLANFLKTFEQQL